MPADAAGTRERREASNDGAAAPGSLGAIANFEGAAATEDRAMTDCWRIDTDCQTLVLASGEGGRLPRVAYWGARLPAAEDLRALARAGDRDLSGGMLDSLPPVTICPEASDSFPGQPGLSVARADGTPLRPRFRETAVTSLANRLEVVAEDAALGLTYRARIVAEASGLFSLSAALEAEEAIRVHWLAAPVLPGPELADEMIDVSGRWLSEFQLTHMPWSTGIRMREALTGRSGHEHFPGALFPARGAGNTTGEVHGLHYGWSGGHRMIAEELADGRRQIQFGNAAGSDTAPTRRVETATLLAAFGDAGLNSVAIRFQRHARDHLVPWPEPRRPRPVHYNCWEAVYFDHDIAALTTMAERAAALGAERFVLDDGWFGHRDDDTTSLGDWRVDRRKWPDGLWPLIDRVHALGMSFGLWFEPEMVNPDSDLHDAHPDWVLGPADQRTGRSQMVLDLGREDVRDHLFVALDALLSEYPIEYVKWDYNRVLPFPDAAQTRGTYALLDRLREAHPTVEIESCASGGGRIDFGILARTHRVWLSDSNDALERLRIQHDASLFLPASVTGAHVGPRTSHSSGRVLPMSFRARVAAQRHMGFEMDLRELTDTEARILADLTTWWKANRDWTMRADIHRLDSADPAVTAELQLAEGGDRFVVFAGQSETSAQILPRPLRLTGLQPEARYTVRLLNPEDAPPMSRGDVALRDAPLTLSGQALMKAGLSLPLAWPATMWMIDGRRVEDRRGGS